MYNEKIGEGQMNESSPNDTVTCNDVVTLSVVKVYIFDDWTLKETIKFSEDEKELRFCCLLKDNEAQWVIFVGAV